MSLTHDQEAAAAADLSLYRESPWLRVRFTLWRTVAIFGLIYLANILVNAFIIVIHSGIGSLLTEANLYRTFWLDVIELVIKQAPSLAYSLVGVFVISILFSITARLRYWMRTQSYKGDVQKVQRQRASEFLKHHPNAEVNLDNEQWVNEILAADAQDRQAKLTQIKEWFRYDELLVQWTANHIQSRRFARALLASAIASAGGVIAARIFLLLR